MHFYIWPILILEEASIRKTLLYSLERMIRQVSGHKTQAVFEHYSDHLEMKDTIMAMGNAAKQLFGDVVNRTLNRPVLEA